MDPDFMRGERVAEIAPKCTECGKAAEGNHSWADGSGEICDACLEKQEQSPMDLPGNPWPSPFDPE
jgi:hypothetical protein